MAGLQGVGTALHINDTDQIESIFALKRTKYIANAIVAVENSLFNLLANIATANPSAVITLIGVSIHKANHILGNLEFGLHVFNKLQGFLTVFQ